jgi:hypothetical protein
MPAGVFFERYEKVLAFIKWPIHKIAAGLLLIYALPLVAPGEYLVRIAKWKAAWDLAAA